MRVLPFLPPILWTAFITVVSLLNSRNVPSSTWMDRIHADKIVHVVLYGLLCFFYYRAFITVSRNRLIVMALSSIIAVLTGIVIEMLQWSMKAGRYFEILDIIANITGVIISVILIKRQSQ